MSALEPDRDQIEIFVDAVLRHAGDEGYVSLRSFLSNNQVLKPIRTVKLKGTKHGFLVDVAEDQALARGEQSNAGSLLSANRGVQRPVGLARGRRRPL